MALSKSAVKVKLFVVSLGKTLVFESIKYGFNIRERILFSEWQFSNLIFLPFARFGCVCHIRKTVVSNVTPRDESKRGWPH